jgi:hypothetical protein
MLRSKDIAAEVRAVLSKAPGYTMPVEAIFDKLPSRERLLEQCGTYGIGAAPAAIEMVRVALMIDVGAEVRFEYVEERGQDPFNATRSMRPVYRLKR